MVKIKCPSCNETFPYQRMAFAHVIWKHPRDYVRLKRSITPTNDPLTLMCRKMNAQKKDAVSGNIQQNGGGKKTSKPVRYVDLSAMDKIVSGSPEQVANLSTAADKTIPVQVEQVAEVVTERTVRNTLKKDDINVEQSSLSNPPDSTSTEIVSAKIEQTKPPLVPTLQMPLFSGVASTPPLLLFGGVPCAPPLPLFGAVECIRPLPLFRGVPRPGAKAVYHCNWCSEVYLSVAEVVCHDVSCHTDIRRFHCILCDEVEYTPSMLVSHLRRYHTSHSSFVCKDCNKELSGAEQYYEHVRSEVMQRLCAIYQKQPMR